MNRFVFVPPVVALVVIAATAAVAHAESLETESVTPGWMLEHADLAAVVQMPAAETPDGGIAPFGGLFEVRVDERLRPSSGPESIRIRVEGSALRAGHSYLLFARKGADGVYVPLTRTHAVRDTANRYTLPLLDYARAYAETLADDAKVTDEGALRDLLVRSLSSRSSGVPFAAGRDLIRRPELFDGLSDPQRASVTAALRIPRKPDQDLVSIILAAGLAGDSDTPTALVERLLDPATRHMRRHVTRSLARVASPALVTLLSDKLTESTPAQRADVANALGKMLLVDAEGVLHGLLRDVEAEVRVESAHALGRIAGAVRRPVKGVDPEAQRPRLTASVEPLRRLANEAGTENTKRAALWALAQIDTRPAWSELRRFRDDHGDPRVRELAKRYLESPRVSLVLR